MSGTVLETYDPFFNLAVEDYLLHNSNKEYCLIYINDPSVVVGRHQVIYRETNYFTAEKLNIPVIRRISGGGTVYHDRGNLNYSFIINSAKGMQVDFVRHTRPVIEFLNINGIPAVLSGKSDITVNGFKVSGNAEHVFRERVLHHGTLLFDASLETMNSLLRGDAVGYSTKAIGSNRMQVMNLKGRIINIETTEELAIKFFEFMKEYFQGIEEFVLTTDEIKEISRLAESKYRSWEWNQGFSPAYSFRDYFEAYESPHVVNMFVKDGIIWKCTIEGSDIMAAVAKSLIGCRHMYDDIRNMFKAQGVMINDSEILKFF
ncbi:MAG TPA: lipoate--protein ligase [Bacteroidales bacterium]|nr:lipoate--protein ligase [Bacteroidales bacterium]HOM41338.1 lipoate--protein ligase [Bacteroidales bacterium]HPP93101.1 lipoate--protein ligase [Bacteroidales bacterium]